VKISTLTGQVRSGRTLLWLLPLVVALLTLPLSGCGGSRETDQRQLVLAPVSRLPQGVAAAPRVVRESYQFALANPDVLKFIPCYCGCGADHGSVKDCFVREVRPDGSAVFDDMGLG